MSIYQTYVTIRINLFGTISPRTDTIKKREIKSKSYLMGRILTVLGVMFRVGQRQIPGDINLFQFRTQYIRSFDERMLVTTTFIVLLAAVVLTKISSLKTPFYKKLDNCFQYLQGKICSFAKKLPKMKIRHKY